MYDKKVRNCNAVKKLTDMVLVVIIAFISEFFSDAFLGGKFATLLICMLLIMIVTTPLKLWLDKKIEEYFVD